MPYLPVKKLLGKYYYANEIAEILREIGEIPTNNKDENIELLIKEWPRHGNTYYYFIEELSAPDIRKICREYGIDSKGKEKDLIKRIKKKKLLENTHTNLKFGGGLSVIGIIIIYGVLVGIGVDTLELFEILYEALFPSSNWDNISDGVIGNRYVSKDLGFTIEKLDDTWYFITDFENLREQFGLPSDFPELLGGMIVAKTPTRESVGVEVLKLGGKYEKDLQKRVEKIIEITPTEWNIEMHNVEKDFSPDGDYAYLAYDGINSTINFHHVRIFKIDNSKFYELGSFYSLPTTSQDVRDEIDCIMKSFVTISKHTAELKTKC